MLALAAGRQLHMLRSPVEAQSVLASRYSSQVCAVNDCLRCATQTETQQTTSISIGEKTRGLYFTEAVSIMYSHVSDNADSVISPAVHVSV